MSRIFHTNARGQMVVFHTYQEVNEPTPGDFPELEYPATEEYPDGSDRYWAKLLIEALTHRAALAVPVTGIRLSPDMHRGCVGFFGHVFRDRFWGFPVQIDPAIPDEVGFVLEVS